MPAPTLLNLLKAEYLKHMGSEVASDDLAAHMAHLDAFLDWSQAFLDRNRPSHLARAGSDLVLNGADLRQQEVAVGTPLLGPAKRATAVQVFTPSPDAPQPMAKGVGQAQSPIGSPLDRMAQNASQKP